MLKIIIKTIILVLIILSIYFIVNPSACSNLINGRAVNVREELPSMTPSDKNSELFTPTGDRPLRTDEQPALQQVSDTQTIGVPPTPADEKPAISYPSGQQPLAPAQASTGTISGVTDTNSLQTTTTPIAAPVSPAADPAATATQGPVHTQADVDYAIASRYVELENQYLAQHKDAKNTAKDISYIVMDDFELTPSEWEAFLQRATAENLFEKVRQEQAKK